MRAEVNYHRCRNGIGALSPAGGTLIASAKAHSAWMARAGKLSHTGRGASGRGLADRIKAAGIAPTFGSENLAQLPRYQFGTQPFRVNNRGRCDFSTARGSQVPPHSYASVAREVVTLWMQSPGHRRNVLDRRAERLSTAAAFSNDRNCGKLWFTQIFVR